MAVHAPRTPRDFMELEKLKVIKVIEPYTLFANSSHKT